MKGDLEAKERAIRNKRRPALTCPACGKPETHFAPPSLGEPGFYLCQLAALSNPKTGG